MRRTAIAAAALALTATACSSARASHTASSPKTTATPSISPTAGAAATCTDLELSWYGNGGSHEVKAVFRDLGGASSAGTNLGALQAAATQLASDAQRVLGDLPPSCVPGLRVNMATAMHDFTNAANAINAGAAGDLQTGVTEITAGNDAFARATNALGEFSNAG